MTDYDRYVTPAELREELPFDAVDLPTVADVEFDSALERALAYASDRVEAMAGTRFDTEQVTEHTARPVYAPGHDLPLDNTPIVSVADVDVEDEDDLTEGDDYHVHDAHLELDPDGELSTWPTSRRTIEVTYTYGHESVPEAVVAGVIRIARARLESIELDALESDGDGSYRNANQIEAEVAQTLSAHRAPAYGGGAQVV